MPEQRTEAAKFQMAFLVLLALGISLVFLQMVRGFLSALVLAAITSGICFPLYSRFRRWFRGRRAAAAVITTLLVLLAIILPLVALLGIVASEALQVAESVTPWVEQQIREPTRMEEWFQTLPPFLERLAPYQGQIMEKVAGWVSGMGDFLVGTLAATTRGTASFFLQLFIMLYATFFFLLDGNKVLEKILHYMPLPSGDEELLIEKFVSVSRATIKGTMIIGLVQGGLAGIAFAIAGIQGPAFWGTIMVVLSIIPGIGTALIWVPAVIYLFITGHAVAAVLLFAWCALVVGMVDNVLRPWLVGKDTKMPDLLILLGTLGGLVVFGAEGIIIGPIIAALFVTVWELYGIAFRDLLPEVAPAGTTASDSGAPDPGGDE